MTTAKEVMARAVDDEWYRAGRGTRTADVIMSALSAAGYVIVPREPTPEMVVTATARTLQASEETIYQGIWRAMVAAAEEGGR